MAVGHDFETGPTNSQISQVLSEGILKKEF
jgi:hypothetical protein